MSKEDAELLIPARLGLDLGVFSVKGVFLEGDQIKTAHVPTTGRPVEAAAKCIETLLQGNRCDAITVGLVGYNARLAAAAFEIEPLLEIEVLQAGLAYHGIDVEYVLSLGHENMHYLEIGPGGKINYFSRNGQCAAGSGSFWYQQATRMGYNDRQLARMAVETEEAVPISGRCAVFAKSDMTHAINEGATQGAVAAGMARALVENVVTSVAQNRIRGPGSLAAIGGVANNEAIAHYLFEFGTTVGVEVFIPPGHEHLNALGAAIKGAQCAGADLLSGAICTPAYEPDNPLPPLEPERVTYLGMPQNTTQFDLSRVYLGVDCGSVSTKCVLLDRCGMQIGGIYLPTTGRPALQVLALIREADRRFGHLINSAPIVACTTGSGRFLSQKILEAEYAIDEITCQAEGIKSLFSGSNELSIIEIGGEDSKYIQIRDGVLSDYNMNPVCAAGTGTFLENLAEMLGIDIKKEFSDKAIAASYAVDLGDICTLISQSILASASARGLPLNEQLASLAHSSAQNYLSKTVDKRPLEETVIFAGATAKNQALAAALAERCGRQIFVPPEPELTGALGAALMAKTLDKRGEEGEFTFRGLKSVSEFSNHQEPCQEKCKFDHNCILHIISFADGKKFVYGDRCGRYSNLEKARPDKSLTDCGARRLEIMERHGGAEKESGPTVGIARCGLYFDYYPFWASFFRALGCRVIRTGKTDADILQRGKNTLDTEMCYPLKAIIGHYDALQKINPDYIFLPEVVDMDPPPWAKQWPRSFTCPLLQTLRGTVVTSLRLDPDKVLYAQLNYRAGASGIREQLRPVAKNLLGARFTETNFSRALEEAYAAQSGFQHELAEECSDLLHSLQKEPGRTTALLLSRSYTLYDEFVAKQAFHHARRTNLAAIPHEYLYTYLLAWYRGEISSPYLDPHRSKLEHYLQQETGKLVNIYPAQLQKMLSAVILANFLNRITEETGLPLFNPVLIDPFKCGPNAMLRHYLDGLSGYLRLTLDEHTAAAGLITRLEAFRNTCQTRTQPAKPTLYSSGLRSINGNDWHKILIPEPSRQSAIFSALMRRCGVEAEILPRSNSGDLSLARRFVNGEECLPFIQNLQDYLAYLEEKDEAEVKNTVFFQGWACGPCRYGLYAPAQAMALDRAGYGPRRVCAVTISDATRRFGPAFLVGLYNGLLAMDLLYKMLHRVRPYEREKGNADALFDRYADHLISLLETLSLGTSAVARGAHRKPLEEMLNEAALDFGGLIEKTERRPLILLGGEFYVRLDDRCNQAIIAKIEQAGGEVSLAPMTEIFTYTILIDRLEAWQDFRLKRRPGSFLAGTGYALLERMAHRDEIALQKATASLLAGLEEPGPEEIMSMASRHVSSHYGGEPPMTIGRTVALARRHPAGGAIFVAPFTCMPGSIVEAQQRLIQEELGIPVATIYYDGKENSGRDELVEALVFQARQAGSI